MDPCRERLLVQHIGAAMANSAMSRLDHCGFRSWFEEEEILMCEVVGAENMQTFSLRM